MSPVTSGVAVFVALDQVVAAFGVSERHVLAPIDQLAGDVGICDGIALGVDEREFAAGYGDTYAAAFFKGFVRGQIRHAGRRFGLAVHDEEAASAGLRVLGELAVKFDG